jgi:hypothetical protein
MPLDAAWPGTPGDAGDGQELNWWVEAFKDEMWHLAQQKGSLLRNCVRQRTVTGDATYFERLAPSAAIQKTTRHTPTPIIDVEHSRRKVTMKDWLWSDLVDDEDKRRMMVDPVGAYTSNAGYAMGRKWDELILGNDGAGAVEEGIMGDAYDGTGVAVPFDTANQEVPSGTEGMTISKLLDTKFILDSNNVEMADRCLVISPQQLNDLLNTTEITSSDYNSVKALVDGTLNYFLGFKVVVSTLLPLVGGERACVAFQKNAVGLAVNRDTQIKRDERSDISYALQVFARFTANATRIDDAGVVRVLNVEP